jgi:hypothetical protein
VAKVRSERDAILSLQRFLAGVLPEPWDVRTELEAGDPPERPFALVEQAGNAEGSGAPVTQDLILPLTANLYLAKQPTREKATDLALDLREQLWQAVKWGPDPHRPTTDRIPLFCYDPRLERHRLHVPNGGPVTFTIAGQTVGPVTRSLLAVDVAALITAAFQAGAMIVQAGDIVGQDRGTGLWDIYYGGTLAGQRVGDPTVAAGTGDARTILQGALAPWRGPSDYARVSSFAQNTVRDQSDPTLVMVAADIRLTFARGLPLPLDVRIMQRVSATAGNALGG